MQRSKLITTLSLLAAIGLIASWSGSQPRPAADHQLAIGTVRMSEVMKSLQEYRKLETERHNHLTEFQQQQQQREMELQDMQKKRDVNDRPGSQQWSDDTAAIDKKVSDLEIWGKMTQIQMDRWEKTRITDIYDHVSQAAAQVAQNQHLDLILVDQSPEIGPDMDKVTGAKLDAALSERTILFYNKKADVTQEVLTQADSMFAKPGPGAGPGITPAPAGH